jgi:hypothetical protein
MAMPLLKLFKSKSNACTIIEEMFIWNIKVIVPVFRTRLKFSNSRLNTNIKVRGSIVTREKIPTKLKNTHVKYQKPRTCQSKDISKV